MWVVCVCVFTLSNHLFCCCRRRLTSSRAFAMLVASKKKATTATGTNCMHAKYAWAVIATFLTCIVSVDYNITEIGTTVAQITKQFFAIKTDSISATSNNNKTDWLLLRFCFSWLHGSAADIVFGMKLLGFFFLFQWNLQQIVSIAFMPPNRRHGCWYNISIRQLKQPVTCKNSPECTVIFDYLLWNIQFDRCIVKSSSHFRTGHNWRAKWTLKPNKHTHSHTHTHAEKCNNREGRHGGKPIQRKNDEPSNMLGK